MCFTTGGDHLWHVEASPEDLDMLKDAFRVVFGQGNAQFSEHAHMGTLKSKTGFKKRNEFIKVSVVLILANEISELLCMDNEIKTTDLGKTEFLLGNASLVDLFPDLGAVGLACTF